MRRPQPRARRSGQPPRLRSRHHATSYTASNSAAAAPHIPPEELPVIGRPTRGPDEPAAAAVLEDGDGVDERDEGNFRDFTCLRPACSPTSRTIAGIGEVPCIRSPPWALQFFPRTLRRTGPANSPTVLTTSCSLPPPTPRVEQGTPTAVLSDCTHSPPSQRLTSEPRQLSLVRFAALSPSSACQLRNLTPWPESIPRATSPACARARR